MATGISHRDESPDRNTMSWQNGRVTGGRISRSTKTAPDHQNENEPRDKIGWSSEIQMDSTRSRTGVIFLANGVPIHWRSNKQPMTATSSAMAEIYALSEACRDANLIMWKHQEMGGEVRRGRRREGRGDPRWGEWRSTAHDEVIPLQFP